MLGSPQEGVAFWQTLIEHGVYVNLVLPPAAPAGVTLLRCSVNAAHSDEEIDTLVRAFAALKK